MQRSEMGRPDGGRSMMNGSDSSWTMNTIYEDEEEEEEEEYDFDTDDDDHKQKWSSLPSPSPPPDHNFQPPRLLRSCSTATAGTKTKLDVPSTKTKADVSVSILVDCTCFNLQKGPLTSRSSYFRRHLKELSQTTLPSVITAETFRLVAAFCNGTNFTVTPTNVASLRTAAELLGMKAADCQEDQNLAEITDSYFDRVIAVDKTLVVVVLKSSMRLLPESETAAGLVSRCLDLLDLNGDDGDPDRDNPMSGLADDIMQLKPEQFRIFAESIQCILQSHDYLYLLVDLYIKDRSAEMSENDKMEICNCVDCEKLSPQLLINAIQNPFLPVRFIIQAMQVEQLKTRRAILIAQTVENYSNRGPARCVPPATLGTFLRRDAAAREAGQMKAEMEATSFRIEGLEKEIQGMKKLLVKSEEEKSVLEKELMLERWDKTSAALSGGDGRSASFHYDGRQGSKVERGGIGSISFGSGSRFGDEPIKYEKKKKSGKGKKKGLIEKLKVKFLGNPLAGSECLPQGRSRFPGEWKDDRD